MGLDKAFKSKARTHRERVNTGKGFLERRKDYKVRAKEFHRRQDAITKLRKKVLDKNPNEFHFHMKQSRLVDGIHYDKPKDEDKEMNETEMKIFQTQDKKYVDYKRSIDAKKIERLQSQLHMINDPEKPKNTHTFFVDSDKEKKRFDYAKKLNVDKDLLDMGFNFANPEALKNLSPEVIQSLNDEKALNYRRLDNKIKRHEFLTTLSTKMDMKKAALNKKEGNVKKIKTKNQDMPVVYKWKVQRKK